MERWYGASERECSPITTQVSRSVAQRERRANAHLLDAHVVDVERVLVVGTTRGVPRRCRAQDDALAAHFGQVHAHSSPRHRAALDYW